MNEIQTKSGHDDCRRAQRRKKTPKIRLIRFSHNINNSNLPVNRQSARVADARCNPHKPISIRYMCPARHDPIRGDRFQCF